MEFTTCFSNGEIAVASTIKTSRQGRVYHPQFIVVYHQNAVLHIIKSQIEYTRLSRDDIHQRKIVGGDIQPKG